MIIVIVSFCYVIECLRFAYVLYAKNTPETVLSKFALPTMFSIFAAFFFLYRIVSTLNAQEMENFMDAGLVHASIFITIQAMVLVTSLSVFWTGRNILEEDLINMARIDPLTSVFNRRALDELAVVEIARSIRKGHEPSILMCDIDHFKLVNDQHGHQSDDQTLAEFPHILSSNIRGHDYVARYGGEEFLIVLPETYLDQAVIIA
jgi:predicted signal transduction protein with EAL and GGDEF domain